ncbi:retrotransposon protein, putative, ty1-copia subclass [Tanacetum coccineum]
MRLATTTKRRDEVKTIGNRLRATVEAIGSFDLVLPNGLVILLDNYYGILVSMNNVIYFNAFPRDGIYEIDMHDLCCRAHISKKRIEKLQLDESFDQCVSSLSGKMTRKPFSHQTERATDLLGLIHTDICGLLRHVSRQGASYFISFTNDFSRYGYVYLLKRKHEVFETFKDYAVESTARKFNMVLTKKVDKTPYELWYEKVPNLSYIKDTQRKQWVTTSTSHLKTKLLLQGMISSLKRIITQEASRRSERTHRAHDQLCLNVEVEEHSLGDHNEPANYKAALLDLDSYKWLYAIDTEMQSMKDNQF